MLSPIAVRFLMLNLILSLKLLSHKSISNLREANVRNVNDLVSLVRGLESRLRQTVLTCQNLLVAVRSFVALNCRQS